MSRKPKPKTDGSPPLIDGLIHQIRGERVLLDSDLAAIYGVTTKRLNEAIKRNRQRFPADFMFQLNGEEAAALRSQITTLDVTGAALPPPELAAMRSQFVTASPDSEGMPSQIATASIPSPNLRSQTATSSLHGGRRHRPYAFTEHGALQAANILKSERAVAMSVFVIRAFVQMRAEFSRTGTLAAKLAELEARLTGRLDSHEHAIVEVMQQLVKLLAPPPLPPRPPKPRIGFKP